jgi:hypothetical protein
MLEAAACKECENHQTHVHDQNTLGSADADPPPGDSSRGVLEDGESAC